MYSFYQQFVKDSSTFQLDFEDGERVSQAKEEKILQMER